MSDGQCRGVNDYHYFISLDTIFQVTSQILYVAC